MEIIDILKTLKEFGLHTIIIGFVAWIVTNKRLQIVDRAINHRPAGSPTISQEVSKISHQLDLFAKDLQYVKKEVDEHRKVDEVSFKRIEQDIRILAENKK